MPGITLKNIPDPLYQRLVEMARSHHRSLTNEVVVALEHYVHQPARDMTELLGVSGCEEPGETGGGRVECCGYDKGPERPFAVRDGDAEVQNGGSLPSGSVKSSSGNGSRCRW